MTRAEGKRPGRGRGASLGGRSAPRPSRSALGAVDAKIRARQWPRPVFKANSQTRTPPNRRCRIGRASAPPQWRGVTGYAATCCGRLCECVPSSTLAVGPSRHEGWFTDNPSGIAMEFPYHASRLAPQRAVGAFSAVVEWLTWPASASATVQPSCGDAEPATSPFGAVRPKASLSRCESWRGRGCASGFIAATVRRKQFPLLCHCVRRIPRGTNSFRLPVLHCVATASGAARPSPAGRITTRTR